MSRRTDKTPAQFLNIAQGDRNARAIEELLRLIPIESESVRIYDIRYGMGRWARTCFEYYDEVEVDFVGWEHDRDCVDMTDPEVRERGDVRVAYFPSGPIDLPVDLLLGDFNNMTVKKAEPLLDAVEDLDPRFIIFTDSAPSKLHLNYDRYGLSSSQSVDDYIRLYEDLLPDYELTHYIRPHHAVVISLWTKKED